MCFGQPLNRTAAGECLTLTADASKFRWIGA
jgi:hypothetical protein